MAKIVICPYSHHSKSAKALAEALNTRVVPDGCGLDADVKIINWGSGFSSGGRCEILNKRENVSKAVNKTRTLELLSTANVRTPEWTTSKNVAKAWIQGGATVMCRTTTTGHSGEGIVVAKTVLDLVDAPLYTKYINKDAEYRIHVFDGRVIDQRKKVRATDGRSVGDNHICTHTNGYVFAHTQAPSDCHTQAINAVKALGLDFGAVDVVYKEGPLFYDPNTCSKAYVLEVNTAPGLTGYTVTAYANAIKRKFNVENMVSV